MFHDLLKDPALHAERLVGCIRTYSSCAHYTFRIPSILFSGATHLGTVLGVADSIPVLIFGLTLYKLIEYRQIAPGGVSRVLQIFVRDGATFFLL